MEHFTKHKLFISDELHTYLLLYLDTYGLRLVHGEIPGSLGCYGCVISHIFKGSLSGGSSDDIYEGDEVVEINGIPMASKSDKQIQLIVGTIREDMELTTRSYSTRNHYGGNQVKCEGF